MSSGLFKPSKHEGNTVHVLTAHETCDDKVDFGLYFFSFHLLLVGLYICSHNTATIIVGWTKLLSMETDTDIQTHTKG